MKISLTAFIISATLYGCGNPSQNNTAQIVINKDSLAKASCREQLGGLKRDTTPQGNIIDYKFGDNGNYFFLQWSRKGQELNTFNDTIPCNSPGVRVPFFVAENKDYLFMRYGCGSPCWVGVFLPFNKNEKPVTIMYAVAYDLKNNLVASVDLAENDTVPLIVVTNLNTLKSQKFPITEGCSSAAPNYCLESISIQNKVLYYKWSPNLESAKGQFEKRIKLSI